MPRPERASTVAHTVRPDNRGEQTAARPESVKSASRTIAVLEALAETGHRQTLSELAEKLGVPKSSLHGLLRTLVASGWVQTDNRGTAYSIGLRAIGVATAYLDQDPLVQASGAVLAQLRTELDETIHLARLDGADVVYLASQESAHHIRYVSRIGRRLPAHATALGKILLSMRSPEEVTALLPDVLVKLTPATVDDHATLRAELAEARDRGWSFERGQNTPGLGCFAVVVPGRHPATDAISCSIPLTRLTDERSSRVVAELTRCADEIGQLVRSNSW
jgi:DNA-binding IclR family transcriptional regulator